MDRPESTGIHEQHAQIDDALLEIDALLDEGLLGIERLRVKVSTLAMLMATHFEWEERSSLYTDFAEDHPRFARQIDVLKDEHIDMLLEVRSLAEGIGLDHPDLTSLRMRALITKLGMHERAELAVLQKAHTEDLSPGD